MTDYWLSFRIAEVRVGSREYEDRYKALVEVIEDVSIRSWSESTSFIAFSSNKTIDVICKACKKAIAPTYDLFLIRSMNARSARICGLAKDKTIQELMPYLKRG